MVVGSNYMVFLGYQFGCRKTCVVIRVFFFFCYPREPTLCNVNIDVTYTGTSYIYRHIIPIQAHHTYTGISYLYRHGKHTQAHDTYTGTHPEPISCNVLYDPVAQHYDTRQIPRLNAKVRTIPSTFCTLINTNHYSGERQK